MIFIWPPLLSFPQPLRLTEQRAWLALNNIFPQTEFISSATPTVLPPALWPQQSLSSVKETRSLLSFLLQHSLNSSYMSSFIPTQPCAIEEMILWPNTKNFRVVFSFPKKVYAISKTWQIILSVFLLPGCVSGQSWGNGEEDSWTL